MRFKRCEVVRYIASLLLIKVFIVSLFVWYRCFYIFDGVVHISLFTAFRSSSFPRSNKGFQDVSQGEQCLVHFEYQVNAFMEEVSSSLVSPQLQQI